MKKLIFIFLCIFITKNVYAYNLNIWQEEKINDPNLIEETEIRYKWYKEEKKGEYLLNNNDNKYQYIEENNIKYDEFSNWLKECPKETYYEIEEKELYPYQTLNKIKYIKFNVVNNPIIIYDIKILINDKEIDNYYTTYEGEKVYYNTSIIEFHLNEEYDASEIKIILESSIKSPYQDIVTASLYTTNNVELFRLYFSRNKEMTAINFLTNDYSNKIQYENDINKIKDIKWVKKYNKEKLCRYRSKYQYYYNINKTYYDDNYYLHIDNYIKDENNYKIYYKYTKNDNILNLNEIDYSKLNINDITLPATSKSIEIENETINHDKIPELNETTKNKVINELKINSKIDNIYTIIIITTSILLLSIIIFKKYIQKKKYMI